MKPSAADLFAAAEALEAKVASAFASIPESKLEAVRLDAAKPKPTTEPGRLMRRAEAARSRAEAEAEKEKQRDAKLAERALERERREADRVAKEALKEAEKKRKEAEKCEEKARREAEKEAEKAQKEAERKRKEEERTAARLEKERDLAAQKAAKEAERVAEQERRRSKLEAEKAQKEAEKAEKERLVALAQERCASALPRFVVEFLLKNPTVSNRDAAAGAVVHAWQSSAEHSSPLFELTKAAARAKIGEVTSARAPSSSRWEITPEALVAVGLAEAEAEAMRPATELTEAEKEKLRKERERREERERKAKEEEKRAEQKAKQASILKGFFAAAPKRPAVPESNVVTAPLVPVTEKGEASEEAERAYAEAVRLGNTVAVETLRAETLARWKRTKFSRDANEDANEDRAAHSNRTTLKSGRWGARRAPKRRRGADAADPLRAALERSALEAASSEPAPAPKRRKLISVDCSSEYEDRACYRFGFQLGIEQLDSAAELRKTFPVPGGRPAYWGSGVPPGRPSASKAVTGRRPFALDPETAYRTKPGASENEDESSHVHDSRGAGDGDEPEGDFFDSGDEWEEEEEGESLDDSDAEDAEDADEKDALAAMGPEDEDDKEGFVVPDGYLSEEENAAREGGGAQIEDAEMDEEESEEDEEEAEEDRRATADGGRVDEKSPSGGLARLASDDANRKLRAELARRKDRAARQGKPMVVLAKTGLGAELLLGLAPARFRAPKAGPDGVVAAARPAVCAFKARSSDAAGFGDERAAGDAKRRKALADLAFPERLPELVTFLLREGFGLAKEAATAAFAEPRGLAKTSVRARVADVAHFDAGAKRWEIKPEALASAGLTPETAEALRPEEERAAKAAEEAERAKRLELARALELERERAKAAREAERRAREEERAKKEAERAELRAKKEAELAELKAAKEAERRAKEAERRAKEEERAIAKAAKEAEKKAKEEERAIAKAAKEAEKKAKEEERAVARAEKEARRALKEANKNKKGGAEKTDAAPAVSPIKAMFDRAAEKAPEAGKADDAEGGERRTAA